MVQRIRTEVPSGMPSRSIVETKSGPAPGNLLWTD